MPARSTYPFSDLDVGCAPIFAQNIVPEYHLTIAPGDWATMENEFLNPQFTASGSIIEPPYHPTQLHIVAGPASHDPPGVVVRLNGNTSWLQAIALDANPKMQFVIAFNKVDPDGRFQELRKVKLDMPRSDWSFLQQRVALAWLRGRAGVPAQCANSARVYINGAYYGLYTNVEFQDKSFLKRVYGGDDNDGDLWKGGREHQDQRGDLHLGPHHGVVGRHHPRRARRHQRPRRLDARVGLRGGDRRLRRLQPGPRQLLPLRPPVDAAVRVAGERPRHRARRGFPAARHHAGAGADAGGRVALGARLAPLPDRAQRSGGRAALRARDVDAAAQARPGGAGAVGRRLERADRRRGGERIRTGRSRWRTSASRSRG